MKTLNIKQLLLIPIIALVMVLQGCATSTTAGQSEAYEHGIGYCNAGDKKIIYLKIQYGEVIRPGGDPVRNFTGGLDKNCNNGSGYSAYMSTPKTMHVEWQTIDGPRHNVEVPIRALLTNKHPTTEIKVRLNDEHVQIIQININGLQPFKNAATVVFEQ
jgi:hypothetical protein